MSKIFFLLSIILFSSGIFLYIKRINQIDFEISYLLFFTGFMGIFYFAYNFIQNIFYKKESKTKTEILISSGIKYYSTNKKEYFILVLLIFGSIIFLFLSNEILFLKVFFICQIVISVFLMLLIFFKFIFNDYISFNFEGIILGNRNYYYIIRFDNIQKSLISEIDSLNFLIIKLLNPDDCARYLFIKHGKREKIIQSLFKNFSKNKKIHHSEIFLHTLKFNINPNFLYLELDKYLKFPESRNSLKSLNID